MSEDDALVPDEVTGPGDEPGPLDDEALPRRRNRLPMWAMVAGLTACWFTLFGQLLAVILTPLALILGRRVLKRADADGRNSTERRQAKIGFVAGLIALTFLVVQVALFQLFFEWEKDVPEVQPRTDETPSATTTTEPPG